MGLFTKRTESTLQGSLYQLNSRKTLLFVGLGNIGKEYEKSRHNIGFECLDFFAEQQGFDSWLAKPDLHCLLSRATLGDATIILIKPTTYMNESGRAVQAVQHFYKLTNAQTIVVHDELDLPFGQIRTRTGGSDAGNNGIKSVIQHCGDDFGRIRIGIASDRPSGMDNADFVLAKFSKHESEALPQIHREVATLLSEYSATGQLPDDTRTISVEA